jgi:hypothetical protein
MVDRNEKKAEDCHISLTYFVQYLTRNSTLIMTDEARLNGEGYYKSNTSHIRLDTDRLKKALIEYNYIRRPDLDAHDLFLNEDD